VSTDSKYRVGDVVSFPVRPGVVDCGFITRVWDKPAADPYVTIRTDAASPQTFVRAVSQVCPGAAPAALAALSNALDAVEETAAAR